MKYRLKQWYPSLPNEWKIGEIIVKPRIKGGIYSGKVENGYVHLNSKEVENNSEFWEPVEETYVVCIENGYGYGKWNVFRTNKEFDDKRVFKHFETKEDAQQYVDKHKPCYSKSDIENAIIKIDVEPKQNVHIHFNKFWKELDE